MSATNRYRNVSGAGWTPAGGSLSPLTGIKTVAYDEGNQILEESGDADGFITVGGVVLSNPKVDVTTMDAAALAATVAGTKGSFAYTLRDHTNGATAAGGAKTYTLSNAYLGPRTQSIPYNQVATQNLTFHSTSTDGSTHPMGVSAV